MRAAQVMVSDPVVAASGATCAEVAHLMRARDISVAPVVDNPRDRRYLGTISDRDIVTSCVAQGHDPRECRCDLHLRADTAVVSPDTELTGYHLARPDAGSDSHVRATLVVLDGSRRVVGFIPHPETVPGVVLE